MKSLLLYIQKQSNAFKILLGCIVALSVVIGITIYSFTRWGETIQKEVVIMQTLCMVMTCIYIIICVETLLHDARVNNRVLSVRQARVLKEAGIDIDKIAWRYWRFRDGKTTNTLTDSLHKSEEDYPTLTVHDMVTILPRHIKVENDTFSFHISSQKKCFEERRYTLCYQIFLDNKIFYQTQSTNRVMLCFNTLLWAVRQGFLDSQYCCETKKDDNEKKSIPQSANKTPYKKRKKKRPHNNTPNNP